MKDRSVAKRKDALKLLTKLLKAAREAQIKGKYLALEKIISEASKLTDRLGESSSRNFGFVEGELISDIKKQLVLGYHENNEEKIFNLTKADLRPEHNNLAIIAAKHSLHV